MLANFAKIRLFFVLIDSLLSQARSDWFDSAQIGR